MHPLIAGIGTAVPPHAIQQSDAAEIVKGLCCETPEQERLLGVLYRRSGVETRHSVVLGCSNGGLAERQSFFPPAQQADDRGPSTLGRLRRFEAEAGRLAVAAAQAALHDAHIDAERVTHLITVTCSGFYAPGFDIALIKQLLLASTVARTQVGFMGCHGALNAIRVAKAFLEQNPQACVLICAVELCSLHHSYGWDPDRIVANSLFADGAAALVMTADHPSAAAWRVRDCGSALLDDSEELMTWRIGDHGFEMTLSPRVPEVISRQVRPFLTAWLARHGLTIEQIAAWAIHPGGPRILAAFGEAASLPRPALAPSQQILARYGNMSSPTVLFILDALRRESLPRPCVALGFGPGLAVEAVLLG